MNYDEAMAALSGLEVFGILLGLDRVEKLLHELGNPHHRFRSIHVAGTNGKGSTAVYLASVLSKAGYRTGLYTSPHLSRFTERIRIGGEEISPARVAAYTERIFGIIRELGPEFQPTYFEVTTALAFLFFAEAGVEWAVVEAGLGGRLDATNVIHPDGAVITNVGLEHTEYLGSSLSEIASEKGGIIKPGVEVVTGESIPVALHVLREICERKGTRLIRVGHELSVRSVRLNREDGSRIFDFTGEERQWSGLTLRIPGSHQIVNAATALGVLEGLIRKGVEIPERAVREGLESARWPGRLEILSEDPYLILDGAHNPHAARALRKTLEEDLVFRRLILVIGILRDKDIPAVLTQLLPLADRLILTRPEYFRGADPRALSGEIRKPGLAVQVADRIPHAIDLARSCYEPGDLILVTGSLYTVGEARDYIRLGKGGEGG